MYLTRKDYIIAGVVIGTVAAAILFFTGVGDSEPEPVEGDPIKQAIMDTCDYGLGIEIQTVGFETDDRGNTYDIWKVYLDGEYRETVAHDVYTHEIVCGLEGEIP